MDITNKFTDKSSEKVKKQLDLKASASEEETLSYHYVILRRSLAKGKFAETKLAYHLHTEVQVDVNVLQNGTKNDFSIKTEIDMFKTLTTRILSSCSISSAPKNRPIWCWNMLLVEIW